MTRRLRAALWRLHARRVLDEMGLQVTDRKWGSGSAAGIVAVVLLAVVALAWCGCGILDPSTELMVENRTARGLRVAVWGIPSGDAVPVFNDPLYHTRLEADQSRAWEVEPGWFYIRGEPVGAAVKSVVVEVTTGELQRVPFH